MSLRIIGGKFKGRLLKSVSSSSLRPTSSMLRKAVFDICKNNIEEATFLDLFSGTGAMGFEALSRGAKNVTFVDHHFSSVACIKENVNLLRVFNKTFIFHGQVFLGLKWLKQKNKTFDVVYIDPPYNFPEDKLLKILSFIEGGLLEKDAIVFVEERYLKQKEDREYSFLKLQFVESRKYGSSLLSIFCLKD